MILKIFILLVVYQLKHFIADYPLQGKYMLGKFKAGWDFLLPLSLHCLVHAVFTFLISIWIAPIAVAVFDFIVHFIMDRIKASPKYLGRFKALNEFEWRVHESKIYRALEEGALYDCNNAETYFHERKIQNKYFWWSLGLDQMVHHLTHYIIIFKLIGYLV
jgi:hypothetical protein